MTCDCSHGKKHPHTVADSHVPMYLQGVSFLAQDTSVVDPTIDLSMPAPDTTFIPPADMVPSAIDPGMIPGGDYLSSLPAPVDPLIASGFSPSDAATIQDLAAKGWLNQQDWADLMSGNVSASELAKINYDASYAQEAAQVANLAKAATGVVKAATGTGTQPVSLPPGSSPRVAARPAATQYSSAGGWFAGSTSLFGAEIPNVALVGGAVLLGLTLIGGGSRTRRR